MKNDSNTTIGELKGQVRKFVHERDWERYHNPKDVAESICIESGELLEIFQWITPQQATEWKEEPSKVRRVGDELADIIVYCLSMANTMKIDVTKVVTRKLKSNEMKYPVEKFYGKAHL